MALNQRQKNHVQSAMEIANLAKTLYEKSFHFKESHDEEFDTGQVNDISEEDNELINIFGINFSAIDVFSNQACNAYINYYTNQSVTTREYGKDVRRVAKIDTSKILRN